MLFSLESKADGEFSVNKNIKILFRMSLNKSLIYSLTGQVSKILT